MHRSIAEQGQYLRAVVAGHGRYFGVPGNGHRLGMFRFQVARLWYRTLCRRTQNHQLASNVPTDRALGTSSSSATPTPTSV